MAVSTPAAPALPDSGKVLRGAQDKLLATEAWLARQEDETAHLFGAMAAFAGSMHQVLTETKMREERVEGLLKAVNKPPITATEMAALNRAASKHAAGEVTYAVKALVGQQFWKLSAIGAVALVTAMAASAGGGWLWRDRQAPALTCQDQPDGSRVCYYFVREATRVVAAPPDTAPQAKRRGG